MSENREAAATASAVSVGADWGDEEEYFSRTGTSCKDEMCCTDLSWLSILLYWLLLPLNLFVTLTGVCCDAPLRFWANRAECSRQCGRPICFAPVMWWYQWMIGFRLICCSKKSRFTLFKKTQAAYGGGDWWWMGSGAWCVGYERVNAIMQKDQARNQAFGASMCCVPEVFPPGLLLFLDGAEHKAIRGVIISMLTDDAKWGARSAQLGPLMAKMAPAGCSLKNLDKGTCDRMVAVAIWFMLFGVELTPAQQATAASWGAGSDTAKGAAGFFVFPRFVQRCLCNMLIKKVLKLRRDTMDIARDQGLRPLLLEMNGMLGPHKRPDGVTFADELLYAICFAGVGGTQHGTWATVQMLQKSAIDVPVEGITFPKGEMVPLYNANPDKFIKESLRLDNPVTSATNVVTEPTEVTLNKSGCFGCKSTFTLPKGALNQYVLSIGNRDPAKFPEPDTFNCQRDNLDETLTWNGCPAAPQMYPRICPGQRLSVAIIKAILGTMEEITKQD